MSEWIETELGEYADLLSGYAFKSIDFEVKKINDEYLPVIKIKNVANGDVNLNDVVYYKKDSKLEKFINDKGDILIAMTGNHPFMETQVVGSVSKYNLNEKSFLNQRVGKLFTRDEKRMNNDFLYYLLKVPKYQSLLASYSSGSASQANISKNDILGLQVKIPNIQIQNEIAKTLSSLDSKITLLRQQNQTLEELAQTLFKRWFVDFEFPDENGQPYKTSGGKMIESELGEIPKGWRVGKLSEIMLNHDNKRIPLSSNERLNRKGKYPYHGATSIMDYIDDFLFDGRYVLLGEDGSVVNDEGLPILQFVDGKFWVNNHAHVLEGKGVFSTNYLYLLLRKKNINHIVTGAVQLKINQGNLNGISVLIGKNDTHDKFNQLINPLFNQYFLNKNETQSLTKLRDTLLPKLMSGELMLK